MTETDAGTNSLAQRRENVSILFPGAPAPPAWRAAPVQVPVPTITVATVRGFLLWRSVPARPPDFPHTAVLSLRGNLWVPAGTQWCGHPRPRVSVTPPGVGT